MRFGTIILELPTLAGVVTRDENTNGLTQYAERVAMELERWTTWLLPMLLKLNAGTEAVLRITETGRPPDLW